MKTKTSLWICFKSNKAFIRKLFFPIILLSLLVVSVFSFNKISNKYLYDGIMKQYDYNSFFITYAGIDDVDTAIYKIKNINHITDVFYDYQEHYSIYLEKINNTEINGSFFLLGITDEEMKKKSKSNDLDINDIICPQKFYPDDDIEGHSFIKSKNIINLNNYLNKNMDIYFYKYIDDYKYDKISRKLKIVNTYQNSENIIDENKCYASKNLLTEIFNEATTNIDFSDQIDDLMITIDNSSNFEYVKSEINKLNYDISGVLIINYTFINFIRYSCIVLLFITIIFVTVFIFNLNKKRLNEKTIEYGIMKSIGFSNRSYKKILFCENLIITILCFIFSFILLLCIYGSLCTILNTYPFLLDKIPIIIDFSSFILFFILLFVVLELSSITFQHKIIKRSIMENIGD